MDSGFGPRDLQLYREDRPAPPPVEACASGALPEVFRAFHRLTGRRLRYLPAGHEDVEPIAEVEPVSQNRRGRLIFEDASSTASEQPADDAATGDLASALEGLLDELATAHHALWQREAELATGIPFVPHADESAHLATRLEAVLHRSAEAMACDAAALYLLDEATTTLKIRSSWGLPRDRMTEPPRSLQGSLADLEAMLGHAVVLEDDTLAGHWNPPEDFVAGVCVPVCTPTTILGTLWFFANDPKSFGDQETHVAEMAAGRIAADLEREVLRREGLAAAQLKLQVAAAQRLQQNQLPSVPPLVDGWDIAARTDQAEGIGGDFHDWFPLPSGAIAVAAGHVMQRGVEAALASAGVKSALRSHGQYQPRVADLLEQVNMTMWTGSAGEQIGSVFCGFLDGCGSQVHYAVAGMPNMIRVAGKRWKSLTRPNLPLGVDSDTPFRQRACRLGHGEVLVVLTEGARCGRGGQTDQPLTEGRVAALVGRNGDASAKQIAALVRQLVAHYAGSPTDDDRTILVIKRAPA